MFLFKSILKNVLKNTQMLIISSNFEKMMKHKFNFGNFIKYSIWWFL